MNYRYVEDELRYLLDDADAKAVVFHREFAPKLAPIRWRLPLLRPSSPSTRTDGGDARARRSAPPLRGCAGGGVTGRGLRRRSSDDLYILYTGGTTGMPKGVMWRAEDIFFGALGGGGSPATRSRRPRRSPATSAEAARCLPACPFMHGTAHWMAFNALFGGGCVVISADRRFDAGARCGDLVARERVNFLVIVGDAFARPLVEALDRARPAARPVVAAGRDPLRRGDPVARGEAGLGRGRPPALLVDGYGSSESGARARVVAAAGTEPRRRARFSVNDETTVLDDDLRPAPVGVVGKLARRGRIPLGYYKDPEKTAATFPVVDGVRWSVPGDHARIEADGTITVLGRGSVSINTGGEKVYPEEVEAALKSHPDVFDTVVVGVPDERWGSAWSRSCSRATARASRSRCWPTTCVRTSPYKVPSS